MLSDTNSMKILNALSLNDKDENSIILKFIVSCKNVGGLFPRHNNIIFIFFLEGRSLPSKFQLKPVMSFILLFIYSVIHSIFNNS